MDCKERIVLLTSRAAERVVRHFAGGHLCVDVEVLPVNVAAFLTVEGLERILASNPQLASRLRGASLVVVPGLVRGDTSKLSRLLGVRVVKGTRSASGIPALLRYIEDGGDLSATTPADEIIRGLPAFRGSQDYVRVGPVEVPLRGPPIVIAAEIPPHTRDVGRAAGRAIREGASLLVIGATHSTDPSTLASRVVEALGVAEEVAVLAESPTPEHGFAAIEAGAHGLASSPGVLSQLEDLVQGKAVLVADRNVDALFLASESLRGRSSVLADPVLDMPLIGFASSLRRFEEASRRIQAPLVFSAANAATEIEADTHGVHALLAAVAVELEASVYYVVEDRYKDAHSVAEAREALLLAERAYETGMTERGLPSRLLVLKQAEPPPPPRLPPGEPIGRIEPRVDPAGYFLVDTDHGRGRIILEFRGREGRFRLEAPRGLDLARAALARARVSLEHAAYLGYELCRAELALRLGKTYIQDEDPIHLPWEDGSGEG